jgi:gas vesicle protein
MGSSHEHESGTLSDQRSGNKYRSGVALLCAPKSGSRMREVLRDYAARAKDEHDEAVDLGTDAWNSARDRGEELIEKGKNTLRREASRQARGFAEAGGKIANETKDDLASRHR